MKVWTVEWHGDYDGGEVYKIFDSLEKAEKYLNNAISSAKKGEARKERFRDWLHRIKPPEPHLIAVPNTYRHEYASPKIKRWNDLWHKVCNIPVDYEYVWSDMSIREYEVL